MAADSPKTDMAREKTTPHDLVKKEDVVVALKNQKGPNAQFKSFEVVDFTSKGDNYACIVSSVEVDYVEDGSDKHTTFVVKLNPCRVAQFDLMAEVMFEKEIGFYTTMLPMLNSELERVNERALRVPNCLHSVKTLKHEVIYLEDLRKLGYKMFDRKKGMDKAHTELILVELARFHAASSLLMSRGEFKGADMLQKLPILKEAFDAMNDPESDMNMDNFFPGIMENASKIAGKSKGYELAETYLLAIKDTAADMLKEQLKVTEQFKVICHGDCWNNNFLFRYGADDKVEECRLVDLQITRIASPTVDLNYMLYCSLNGDVRRNELPNFFMKYYATFASVMAAGSVPMKFTLKQFEEEFKNKNTFGLLMGLMLIPIVLMNAEDAPDFEDMVGDNMDQKMAEYQELIMEQVQKNPLLRPRLLDLFDEMIESGVIHKLD